MSSKTLLVGTSFSAVPLYKVLQRRSLDISVCGNLPSDPCHQYVDHSFDINYAIREDLYDLVRQQGFDYIVPSCNDYAYMSCAWVAEQLNLPGFDSFETTRLLHNKDLFRQFAQTHLFPTPKAIELKKGQKTDLDLLNLPVLVKPVDSFSGRGVTKVTQVSNLTGAINHAFESSKAQSIVIEEFIEGTLHSHSCFIHKGRIIYQVMADEFCTVYPYQVNCSNIPTRLEPDIGQQISECMQDLVTTLKLKDGLLHTQLIVNDNQFQLIECMRRAPGDLYGTMVELAASVDYWNLYTRPFINEQLNTPATQQTFNNIARHTLSTVKGQYFHGFSSTLLAQKLFCIPLKGSGHYLDAAPYDKAGIIFAEFDKTETLFKLTPVLADKFIL